MSGGYSSLKRWQLSMFAFLAFFLFIFAGFSPDLGREMSQREEFSYPYSDVWKASDRAEESMPEEYWLIFQIVMGNSLDSENHNTLKMDVFRETVKRNDNLRADNVTSQYFDIKFNWQTSQNELSSIWGIADTVRSIMNNETPLTSAIGYTGPNFESADQEHLTIVLNSLFNFQADDGSFPYRNIVSPDLCVLGDDGCVKPKDEFGNATALIAQSGNEWKSKGFSMVGEANSSRLYADYPRQRGDYEHFEYWEQKVDAFYLEDLDSDEEVNFYSYLAFGLELEDQINSTAPLIGLSFFLMVALLSFYFRNVLDVLVSGLGLALVMICMTANSFWLGFPQTQLAAMLPILMLALGVDFVIHSLTRWRRLTLENPIFSSHPREASILGAFAAIKSLLPALGVATVTTVVAFGTATLSEIPDLFEWGILGPLGIIQAYLIMGVFVPVLRSIIPPKESSSEASTMGQFFSVKKLSSLMASRSMPMLVIFLIISVALSPLVLGNPESRFDVKDYADNDSRFIQTVSLGQATFTENGEPGYYLIEGENLASYETVVQIDNMEQDVATYSPSATWLGSIPYVVRTQSLLALNVPGTGYVPQTVDPQTGFPTSDDEISKVLKDVYRNGTVNLEGTFRISPSEARELYLIENGNVTMARSWFQVERPDDIYGSMMDLKEDLENSASGLEEIDGVSVTVAGLSYERYVYMLEITDSFQESLVVAIVLAFVIVLIVLRDVRLSLITILPVIAITLWLRGGMVLSDTPVNLVTVQISSLAIGLGVDYAIHMVQRVREARFENPSGSQEDWMEESLDETGNNVAMSAFTDFIGFMVLALSIMPLFVTFGLIMAVMIFLSFVAAVIMLPALLYQFGNLESSSN